MSFGTQVSNSRITTYFLIAFVFSALSWSPFRPIWLDEVIQFCLTPFSSLSEAWSIFRLSLTSMNPGQTGMYHVANYLLLNQFGASPWALRFPSFFASIYTYWIALILMGELRIGFPLRASALILIFLNTWITYAFSDARAYPYIILGFSSALLFYLSDTWPRRRLFRSIAYPALVLSALFHPYFIIYLAGAWAVGAVLIQRKRTVAQLWSYSSFPAIAPILLLYGAISYFTWVTHMPAKFGFDPYEFLRKDITPLRSVLSLQLASFAWMGPVKAIFIPLLGILPLWSRRLTENHHARMLLHVAMVLYWASLATTGIICWQSIRNEYWIIPRQWVGSSFGLVLAFCFGFQGYVWAFQDRFKWIRHAPWPLFVFVLFLGLRSGWDIQVGNRNDLAQMKARSVEAEKIGVEKRNTVPATLSTAEAVELAQLNMAEGGPVWPVFKGFYGKFDLQNRGNP